MRRRTVEYGREGGEVLFGGRCKLEVVLIKGHLVKTPRQYKSHFKEKRSALSVWSYSTSATTNSNAVEIHILRN